MKGNNRQASFQPYMQDVVLKRIISIRTPQQACLHVLLPRFQGCVNKELNNLHETKHKDMFTLSFKKLGLLATSPQHAR